MLFVGIFSKWVFRQVPWKVSVEHCNPLETCRNIVYGMTLDEFLIMGFYLIKFWHYGHKCDLFAMNVEGVMLPKYLPGQNTASCRTAFVEMCFSCTAGSWISRMGQPLCFPSAPLRAWHHPWVHGAHVKRGAKRLPARAGKWGRNAQGAMPKRDVSSKFMLFSYGFEELIVLLMCDEFDDQILETSIYMIWV